MSNPFSTTAPAAAPVTPAPAMAAAPVTPAAPVMPAAPAMGVPGAPAAAATAAAAGKKDRKKPNRQMTAEERKYVIENYATKQTSELAQELNLTRQQVYGTVRKSRERIQERINQAQQAGDTKTVETLTNFLNAKLPEKPFGGGVGANRGSSIDSAVDSLLSGLL